MQQQTQTPDSELGDLLRHQLVQKARAIWTERKKQKRGILTFEEWLVRLCEGMSIADIARLDGTTRQAAQQTYVKYFRALFQASGSERLKERTVESRNRDEENLRAEVLKSEEFRKIAEIAQPLGFSVESCAKLAKNHVANPWKHRILINEKFCGVTTATRPYTPSLNGPTYARHIMTAQSLQEIAYLIFQVAIEGLPRRYFVIPSTVLFEYGRGKKCFYVYIPLETTRSAKSPARVDYRQFEEAWHLLATESLPRTPASR